MTIENTGTAVPAPTRFTAPEPQSTTADPGRLGGLARGAGRNLLRLVYGLSAAILIPYSLWVFAIERESFSRVPVIAGILFHCVLTGVLYFSADIHFRRRFSWKKALFLAVLFMVLGLGFVAVISMIGFAYACEGIALAMKSRGRERPRFRPLVGAAMVVLLAFVAFPLLNDMYFRGTQAQLLHPNYNRYNVFYRINDAGFRGPKLSLARTGKPRLMFLGDSSPFGWPYEYAESFPFLVESSLQSSGIDVEVLNAATIGQSIGAIRAQLPYFLAYKPDVVFLMTGVHYHRADRDFQGIMRSGRQRDTGWRPFVGVPPMLIEVAIFSVASSPLFGRRNAKKPAAERPRELASFELHLREVVSQIGASGARLYLVDYPTPGADRHVQNEIRRIAAELKVPYVPLHDLIGAELRNHLHDETHPDKEGHRMIAREIASVAKGIVPAQQP